jgi:hypothetical protein
MNKTQTVLSCNLVTAVAAFLVACKEAGESVKPTEHIIRDVSSSPRTAPSSVIANPAFTSLQSFPSGPLDSFALTGSLRLLHAADRRDHPFFMPY